MVPYSLFSCEKEKLHLVHKSVHANAAAEECMAIIQVIRCGSTDVEKSLAGYLRAWRWDAENPYDNCRSFSLIIVAI